MEFLLPYGKLGMPKKNAEDFIKNLPHWFLNVPERIRTAGLPLRRRTLYPAELQKLSWNDSPFFIGNHSIDIHYSIPKAVNPALFQNLCGPASRYFP